MIFFNALSDTSKIYLKHQLRLSQVAKPRSGSHFISGKSRRKLRGLNSKTQDRLTTMELSVPPSGDIPTIDLSLWKSSERTSEDTELILSAVRESCCKVGFILITGHGVDDQPLRRAFMQFFQLPPEVKGKYAPVLVCPESSPPGLWSGFMAQGSKTQTTLREMYSLAPPSRELEDWSCCWGGREAGFVAPVRPQGPEGVWPQLEEREGEEVLHLRPLAQEYWQEMQRVSDEVLSLLGSALGLPSDWAQQHTHKQGMTQLVAAHYPPQVEEPPKDRLRVAPHSDAGSLTVVAPDEGGLQVLRRDGTWEEVPCVPGTMIVNLGDMMEVATGGRWVSSKHRVVNPPRHQAATHRRLSLLFFHNFNFDTIPYNILPPDVAIEEGEGSDRRQEVHDGDLEGAILGERAMEKVAGYENMTAGEYHFLKTSYRYQV